MMEAYKYATGQAHVRLSLLEHRKATNPPNTFPSHTPATSAPLPHHTSTHMSHGEDDTNLLSSSGPRRKRRMLPPPSSTPQPHPTHPPTSEYYKQAMEGATKPVHVESRDERMGRRIAQKRQMERLAGKSGGGLVLEEGRQTFTCADGVTKIPYEVMGKLELKVMPFYVSMMV